MSLYSLHRDQCTWGDPEVFRPERFIDKDGKLESADNVHFFGCGKSKLSQRTTKHGRSIHCFVVFFFKFYFL